MSERYTPPLWTRHFIPYLVLLWISERYATCWAGMVMWKQGYDWGWWPVRSCFDPQDYCGKFDKAPCALAESSSKSEEVPKKVGDA